MIFVLCEKNEVIKPTFVCFSRDVYVKFVVLYNMFELLLKKATFSRDVVNFESQSSWLCSENWIQNWPFFMQLVSKLILSMPSTVYNAIFSFRNVLKNSPNLKMGVFLLLAAQPPFLRRFHHLFGSRCSTTWPSGSFCLVLQKLVLKTSVQVPNLRLHSWYMDDGSFFGNSRDVLKAWNIVKRRANSWSFSEYL